MVSSSRSKAVLRYSLFELHLLAVRVAKMIDPGRRFKPEGVDNECISVPAAYRISVPLQNVRVLWKLPAIHKNFPPFIRPFEVMDDPVLCLNEFKRRKVGRQDIACQTRRRAVAGGIVPNRRRHCSAAANVLLRMLCGLRTSQRPAIAGLVGLQQLLTFRSHRGNVITEAGISTLSKGTPLEIPPVPSWTETAPYAGQIMCIKGRCRRRQRWTWRSSSLGD